MPKWKLCIILPHQMKNIHWQQLKHCGNTSWSSVIKRIGWIALENYGAYVLGLSHWKTDALVLLVLFGCSFSPDDECYSWEIARQVGISLSLGLQCWPQQTHLVSSLLCCYFHHEKDRGVARSHSQAHNTDGIVIGHSPTSNALLVYNPRTKKY